MRNNNKGITLVSLIMYCAILMIIIGVVATVRTNSDKELDEIRQNATYIPELNKLSMYMLQEVKDKNNVLKVISADNSFIQFENGNKYLYENGNIFKINETQNVRICENITQCTFSYITENGKDALQIYLTLGGDQPISKVLKYGIASSFEGEVIVDEVRAILYSDGVLAFNTTGNLAEGKTDEDVLVRSDNIKNTSFSSFGDVPWYANRATITTINFEEEIYPTSTKYWFYNCTNLTQINNISNLDTSQVTNMSSMFYYCTNLTSIDVSEFDTSKVIYMNEMFSNCSSLTSIDVSGFDTSQVTHMGYMFYYCSSLTSIDVSGFDTSEVTNMSYMFSGCSGLTSIDVSGFDTSRVKNMNSMFYYCSDLISIDVSGFDTSKVTNMSYMFFVCRGLTSIDVSGFDTSKVNGMSNMFGHCSGLTSIDVSGFDTSQVEDMSYMFGYCTSLTSIDVSGFDTSKVTNMSSLFGWCTDLTTIYASDLWTTGAVTSGDNMFYNCTSLVGQGGITYNSANAGVARANYSGGYLTYVEPHLTVTPNTTESTSSVTVTMTKRATLTDYTIKYKIDDGVWQIYTAPITITSNCKVTARIENTSNEYLGTRRLNITNIV